MATFTCPPGFQKNIDLDSNTEYCSDATGKRAPAIYSSSASVVAFGGLAAVAIVVAAVAMSGKKKRGRR
jgi:hypothetical protein